MKLDLICLKGLVLKPCHKVSDFEAGMTKIAAINGCLEESRIVMSNSRRLLQRIGADVKSAMRVTSADTTATASGRFFVEVLR